MTSNLLSNRLLVVDNEPALGRLIKNAAESAGFEVFVTKSPTAFSEKARVWSPTLVMLDLGMPGTDGIQLLRRLAADKSTAHVILMSGADSKVVEFRDLTRRCPRLEDGRRSSETRGVGGAAQVPRSVPSCKGAVVGRPCGGDRDGPAVSGISIKARLPHCADDRSRSACPLAPPGSRDGPPRPVHPARRGIRSHSQGDRLGRRDSGKAAGRLAGTQPRPRNRGQRFGQGRAGSQPARSTAQTLPKRGDRLRVDDAGTHRDRRHARSAANDGRADPATPQGLQIVDRRFRDGDFHRWSSCKKCPSPKSRSIDPLSSRCWTPKVAK